MIYPIVAYGNPVLKRRGSDIEQGSMDVEQLSKDMFETMYQAGGVGLAAPQIGLSLRMFVIDTVGMEDEEELEQGTAKAIKMVFINPQIIEESGEEWAFEEGCLSIPKIREDVFRKEKLHIRWFDEKWVAHEASFDDMAARVIQHEYDHIEGVLFTDHLSAFKKRLLKAKLANISKGNVIVDYKMLFPDKR
jgi:peptide deformylase